MKNLSPSKPLASGTVLWDTVDKNFLSLGTRRGFGAFSVSRGIAALASEDRDVGVLSPNYSIV